MTAFYNEIDPYAAQWLRNLIAAGHIADGVVDERSIAEITPQELREYTQCHFFAGIGAWSLALRLAQWPDSRPVWTGSCPCQPFSVAGRSAGVHDERHLWPHWHWLIAQHRPPVIFGEQVEAALRHGWLDLVQADLEGSDYAVAPVVLPVAGVGSPHIRQRLWWVADTNRSTCHQRGADVRGRLVGSDAQPRPRLGGSGLPHGLADNDEHGRLAAPLDRGHDHQHNAESRGELGGVAHHHHHQGLQERGRRELSGAAGLGDEGQDLAGTGVRPVDGMADSSGLGSLGGRQLGHSDAGGVEHQAALGLQDFIAAQGLHQAGGAPAAGPTNGGWAAADWLLCRDGRWRPVEPGTFPLAHGAAKRVGRLRAYGNAIVPQVAAEVISAYMEVAP